VVHRRENNEVAEILRRFHLDESAIEAQAIKRLASELEIVDKRLMSLETRRNRAIRNIAEYRESFARKVRESSGRIIEADSVVRLENPSGRKSA
jgi:ribonuclease D